ncbi:hypothetical protein [Pedobacter sp. Leaf170]|uniref:hypothetical protein n=1 Tax=Pedobacter sp. Leaf170 TaxID=2876558 RepID=UPI001E4A666D|nr:hypothetical protein [Pedobacter sp. Leaf170]
MSFRVSSNLCVNKDIIRFKSWDYKSYQYNIRDAFQNIPNSCSKTIPEIVKNAYLEKAKALGYKTEELIWTKHDKD